jgi:hypothetical protein
MYPSFQFLGFERLPMLPGTGRIHATSRQLSAEEILQPVGIVDGSLPHPGDHGLLLCGIGRGNLARGAQSKPAQNQPAQNLRESERHGAELHDSNSTTRAAPYLLDTTNWLPSASLKSAKVPQTSVFGS